jgi:hypothetical protein
MRSKQIIFGSTLAISLFGFVNRDGTRGELETSDKLRRAILIGFAAFFGAILGLAAGDMLGFTGYTLSLGAVGGGLGAMIGSLLLNIFWPK